MKKGTDAMRFFVSIILCQAAGAVGGLYTAPAIPEWYAGLTKPSFTPPDWLFGPVWTMLYLLMGVALYLVWRQGIHDRRVQVAMVLFFGQLALNVLWTVLFFGMQSPQLAFIEIILLLLVIAANARAFHRISKPAGLLLVPYMAWVCFAALLNGAIWRLN